MRLSRQARRAIHREVRRQLAEGQRFAIVEGPAQITELRINGQDFPPVELDRIRAEAARTLVSVLPGQLRGLRARRMF